MQVSCGREHNFLVTGTYAVEFFFCLSGYLLLASFENRFEEKKPILPQIIKFILSRLKKFVPLCWLFAVVSGAYHVYLYSLVGYTPEQLTEYVRNLWPEFLMLNGIITCPDPANGPTWYISILLIVSVVYYAIFAFCKSKKISVITVPAILSTLIYILSYCGNYWPSNSNLLRGICCIGLGNCLYYVAKMNPIPCEKYSVYFGQIIQLLCILVLIWIFCIRPEDTYTAALLIPFFLILLFTVFMIDTPLNRILDNPISAILGEVSLTMYLSHILLLTRILWQPHFDLNGNIVIVYLKVIIIVFAFSLIVQNFPKLINLCPKKTKNSPGTPNRLLFPDILRACATIGVILFHVSGGMMWMLTPNTWQFKWLAPVRAINFVVPVFLMLSGMFLLSPEKEVTLYDIFKKYIFRLILAYVGWSAIYALFTSIFDGSLLTQGLHGLWDLFIDGHYHLWFIPMMIGTYLTIPFFRGITEKKDDQLLRVILVILLLYNVLYGYLERFPSLQDIMYRINPSWFEICATYFYAGYYFSRVKLSKSGKYIWPILFVISVTWLGYSINSSSIALNALNEKISNIDQIPTVICSISIFMTIRHWESSIACHHRICLFMRRLSKVSFTVYLSHDLFIVLLANMGFTAITWHPLISVPLITITVLISSMILSETMITIKNNYSMEMQTWRKRDR